MCDVVPESVFQSKLAVIWCMRDDVSKVGAVLAHSMMLCESRVMCESLTVCFDAGCRIQA